MALKEKSEIREVTGITDVQKQSICDFLQGAIYCWCKNRKGEWFAMRDLMGGDNFFWEGTPLYELYLKHERMGKGEQAIGDAAKDAGWLLKKVIDDDKRIFDSEKRDLVSQYKWDGDGSY